jgi:multidrug efflux system outer membrane protein
MSVVPPLSRVDRSWMRPSAVPMLAASVAACLTGCAVGPNFVRPQPATPARWTESAMPPLPASGVVSQARPSSMDAAPWWESFQDAELTSLAERAVKSNYSLQDAMLRIAQSRAQRDISAADRWPALSGNGLFTRQRISEKTATGALFSSSGTTGFALPGVANPFNQSQLGFDASWELDLFGRVRRQVEAADADSQASLEAGRDVLMTLLGDVARGYLELRGEQLRLAISQRNLASEREVLELTRDRQKVGIGNDVDVANAAAQVAGTEALLPDLQRQITQSINQLSLLVSREPAALSAELIAAADVPHTPPEVPVGLPADLVRRRPDIRLAEAELHSATARVGVADADLFPRLTLNAGFGLQAQEAGDLGAWASRFASVGPKLELPILDGGRRRATVRLQSLREQQAALAYEHTVLAALHEAENSLVAFSSEQSRRASLDVAVTASRDALSLSRLRYESGVIGFLNVLDAERNLEQAELTLALSTTAVSTNLVALYKALGGGWQPQSSDGSTL